jgi:phage-related protein
MAVQALAAVLPALARVGTMVGQGVARAGAAAARGLGAAARGVARGVGGAARGIGKGSGGSSGEGGGKGLLGFLGNPLKKINTSFLSLGKNLKSLQLGTPKLSKAFQFMGKGIKSLTDSGIASASSVNDLSSSLIGMIPVIGETAQKFVSFAEGIATTVVNTLTGLPNFLQSKFGGIVSLVKSYSPAQARQVEIAFGQMRATIGRYLVPLAPMIRNLIINITKFVKDGLSKIDVKKAFKWIVFLMFLAVGVVIGTVKLIIRIINGIREFFSGGLRGIFTHTMSLLQGLLAWIVKWLGYLLRSIPKWLLLLVKYIIRAIGSFMTSLPGVAVAWIKGLPGALKRAAIYIVGLAKDTIVGIVQSIIYYLPQIGEEILNFLSDAWDSIKGAWKELINWIVDEISNLANSIWEALKKILPDWLIDGFKEVGGWISWAWDGVTGFVSDVWDSVTESATQFWNDVKDVAQSVGDTAQELWDSAKELVPESVRENVSSFWNTLTEGISDAWNWFDRTFSTGSENVGKSAQEQQQAQQGGADSGDSRGSEQGAEKSDKGKESGTPESMMQGVADFFNELGLGDLGSIFGDMANMFEDLFKDTGNEGLSFEAKEGTHSTVEDIGKAAREAALGVNKKPEEKTAEASQKTSQNTSEISQGVRGLVSALPSSSLSRLAQEAEASSRAIEVLNKTNREGVEASMQEQTVVVNGIDAMAKNQELTNELLSRMADSQRHMVEMERSKNYSFGSLRHSR